MTITARRSVRSHKNDMFSRDGKSAFMTCGIVSPIMMQNAIIPPNALYLLEFGSQGEYGQPTMPTALQK